MVLSYSNLAPCENMIILSWPGKGDFIMKILYEASLSIHFNITSL